MNKILFYALLLTLLPLSFASAKDIGDLRYSITVTKFKNQSNAPGKYNLPVAFAAMLTDSLQQTGKFIVLGENDMRQEAMKEQDFGESGRVVRGNKTPEIGKMTPAQLLVKGEITHFQESTSGGGGGVSFMGVSVRGGMNNAEINAVIYVVDSTTGQVVASKKVVGSASRASTSVGVSVGPMSTDMGAFRKSNVGSAVEKAIDEAVEFISQQLGKIPWEGSIVAVKGNKVYINRGAREGVKTGQRFTVGTVERITDPDTGELLDITVERVAGVKVDEVKEKLSIASIIDGDDRIQKGMTVVLP